jgi:hypothetical protein
VATVSTEYKRAFLRELKWTAEDGGLSLHDAIKAALRGRVQATSNGQAIVSTSANGQNVQFSLPSSGSVTGMRLNPQDIAELCEELMTRYEAAATETESSDDAVILTEMLALLEPVTEMEADFSGVTR